MIAKINKAAIFLSATQSFFHKIADR